MEGELLALSGDFVRMPSPFSRKQTPADILSSPLFLATSAFFFLNFSLPIYSKSLGASAVEIGGLFSAFTMTIMVLRPLVGWALDRYGRKRFFLAALLNYAIAMGLFAVAQSLSGLYLARFTQGIASSLLWTSARTIAADLVTTETRGRAMGRMQEMAARGSMLGGLIGFTAIGVLPGRPGWQIAFGVYALFAVLGACLVWRSVLETQPAVSTHTPVSVRPFVPPHLFKLLVVVFTNGFAIAVLSPIYLIFLQDTFSTDSGTLLWAFLPAGIVAGVLPSRLGGLSDRFGRTWLLAIGFLCSGCLSLLLPHVPNLVWLVVLYTFSSVGWAMTDPAASAMVADMARNETRGRVYGLYEFAGSLGATLGPLLGGWLYDAVGQAIPFYLNAAILGASALWVVAILRQPAPSVREAEAV